MNGGAKLLSPLAGMHRRFSPGRNGAQLAHRHFGKTKYP
jgi:hypothetical protein